MSIPENIVFFDAALGGHHGEFLENIIIGAPVEGSRSFHILAHPQLQDRLREAQLVGQSNVKLTCLTETEIDYIESAQGIAQVGRRQLEVLKCYVERLRPSRVVLMHMNVHQYALHNWKIDPAVEIAGILLNPYTPMDRAFGWKAKLFALATGLRKRMQLMLMLRNKQISKVFLLNDARMALRLNSWWGVRPVFSALPDPIPAMSPKVELAGADLGSERAFVFLLAGSLSARKGCLETLEALIHLSHNLDRKVELRLVGRFGDLDQAYRGRVLAKIDELRARSTLVKVVHVEGFLSHEDLSREFAECDCVLVPYLKFYGSSGMIGHACRYNKPLIVCREGLIGEIVLDQRLGCAVNPLDSREFSQAMSAVMDSELCIDSDRSERYLDSASAKRFVRCLVDMV